MSENSATAPDIIPRRTVEQQLNRACEACRLSKVRCLVNPDPESSQCVRCAKIGKHCVFHPPTKRRQRKRTDVRVAELEKEIRQMRSLLKPNQMSSIEESDHDSLDDGPGENIEPQNEQSPDDQSRHSSSISRPATFLSERISTTQHPDAQPQPEYTPNDLLSPSTEDIVDRGLITMAMAEELLGVYRTELTSQMPGVVVLPEWSAATLRSKKPVLFHAIMAAASLCKGMALSNRLHEEVILLYAKTIFIGGKKSLENIQAMIVTVAFYNPPATPAALQIYQFGNIAASMALELGLASKPRTHEQLPKRAIRSLQKISSAEELLENCRTILILYIHTAGFSMRLRRPNILVYNSWMEECLTMLQKSPIIDDRRVVAWLKLQRIADEANTAFGFDDASTSFSLSELRLQVILRSFERRMRDWEKSIPKEVITSSLMIEYHQNMLLMWEFPMDGGHFDAPEYRNRQLTLPALDDDCIQPETLLGRSALQINATIRYISEAHALLDKFLSQSLSTLTAAPNILFVRSVVALAALMKADYAVGTDPEGMGQVLVSEDLKLDFYLDTVIRMTEEAIGPQRCKVPSHWHWVLKTKLKAWHDEHQQWRKDGKHLLPRAAQKPKSNEQPSMASGTVPLPQPYDPVRHSSVSILPSLGGPVPPAIEQSRQMQQDYHMGTTNTFTPWPTTNLTMPSTDASMTDQSAFMVDMSDISSVFQNGDLYLWNDASDNLGAWPMPQSGGLYNDMQYGGMGTHGL